MARPAGVERLEQPRRSLILFEQRPDGVTLTVPYQALPKEDYKAWLTVGACICGGLALFTTVGSIRAVWFMPDVPLDTGGIIGAVLFGVLLWLGAWALYHFARKARPPSMILATADDRLLVHRILAFTDAKWEWTRDELLAIRVAFDSPSGSSPELELQIVPVHGEQVALLTGIREKDLEWVAAVLRHTLDVPESPPASDPR
jgi:hypothetical protein